MELSQSVFYIFDSALVSASLTAQHVALVPAVGHEEPRGTVFQRFLKNFPEILSAYWLLFGSKNPKLI